ncbi:hypothetical protein [Paraburkholderia sp. GAS32]|uniref:hypothetical protein n=1 Tax=Paraburkholderia sp. GAS32 TaxID=3035129 RepID=UPI003D23083A
MKKLTLVSGGSPPAKGRKLAGARRLAALVLVLAMVLMLYLMAHWALTESDPILRAFAALGFLACVAATVIPVAMSLRRWFQSAR